MTVALLHPAGEPGRAGGAAARAALAHLLAERHAGDGARPRRGGAGAAARAPRARLPVQQPRQPAGAQRTHVVRAREWEFTHVRDLYEHFRK